MSARPDDERERLRRLAPVLRRRPALLGAVRGFFADRGFLEVDTPLRLPCPALEDHIDAEPAGAWYLRTSPELHMKRLLAAGYERLFQIGPCFRRGESGPRHLPEFAMLEWYCAGADYRDILADTILLLDHCRRRLGLADVVPFRGARVRLTGPWQELTVDDAFRRFAGTDPDTALAAGEFERLLVERIEPNLGFECPTVLLDYPLALGALARARPGAPNRVERWELYIGGMELANAFSELTDAGEQRRRFAATADLRQTMGRDVYPVDERFLEALEAGLPPTGGIALGLDRLLMVLGDVPRIADVVAFAPGTASPP